MGKQYSVDELVEKSALTVADITNNGGMLNPEQSDAFLRMIQETQTILHDARVEPVDHGTKELDRLGITQRFLDRGTEDDTSQWTNPTAYFAKEQKPTLGKIPINTQKVSGRASVSYETLRRNIEKENFADSLVQAISERVAFDLEDLSLNGDKAINVNVDSYLSLVDGFLKRIKAGAPNNAFDFAGAAFKGTIFRQLIRVVPGKYRRQLSQFRFYVSHSIALAWLDSLAGRQTPGGDVWQTKGDGGNNVGLILPPAYQVPVIACDSMPDNLGPNGDQGTILFTHPKNLIYAIEDQIRILDEFVKARDSLVLYFHAYADSQVEEVNAMSCGFHIQAPIAGS